MNYLIINTQVVNRGEVYLADVFIKEGRFDKILRHPYDPSILRPETYETIDGANKYLLPGLIDDQVHFREPGLTHKGEIFTESKAAVAGGITSFMEMPNTVPNTVTQELLEEKYQRASEVSWANYSFFMGGTNDNLEEIMKTDLHDVCGLKIFMGSSTGNMLVDNRDVLEEIFSSFKGTIALHCEDEATIKANTALYKEKYGDAASAELHPIIRSAEACYKSSSLAAEMAHKLGAKIHILHISSGIETRIFEKKKLEDKKVTAEACIHHLWFTDKDYAAKGNFIKWNPAVKSEKDRDQIWEALLDGRIDVIATDHAPHTFEEKSKPYFEAPSGGPLVQHALNAMLEFYHKKYISLPTIVEKMCHNPAILFKIDNRGFIEEGYFADCVLVDLNDEYTVSKENLLYKCGWSPFEGITFHSKVKKTFVNGNLVFDEGKFNQQTGKRLLFQA